jgi:glycine/D-amino acid oxidase-like deaminating enzyme
VVDIALVGAGVVGAAVAYRLAEAGARVTVLEAADHLGAGTSGRSFAWTNANDKPPRAYHDLNVAGMRAHAALRDEFGRLPWWHGGGSIDWFATDDERVAQRARIERLQAWGYAAEWITPQQLHELEPDIDLAGVGDAPIAYYPEEGWLDPIPYLHVMLEAAQRHGAVVRTGARVEQVHLAGGRVSGLSLQGGERLTTDVVVNCAGRWADTLRVADAPALRLPLAPTVGLLVLTPPVASCLQRVVRSPWIHMRPDGAGRLMLHGDDGDAAVSADTEPSSRLAIAHDMARRVAGVLPGVGSVTPEAARIAVRPIPADGLSAVGPMPGVDGYYVVVTHSGVTLSPFLAHVVASELLHGAREAQLEPFRPSRLVDSRTRSGAPS